MADNVVRIVFEGEARGLFNTADSVFKRVQSVAAETTSLGAKTRAAAVDVSKLNNGFLNVASSAKNASLTIGGLSPQIAKARAEVDKLRRSEEALARIRGSAPNGRGALTGEQRYGRINLARQGADVFTQLGSGQGVGITAIQQGPQIVEAMAMSGLKLSTYLTASVAAVGLIAAAGIGVVKWSQSVRDDAEKRLKTEELIVGAMNRQILAGKEITDNLQKQLQLDQSGREFNRFLQKSTLEQLESRLRNVQQLQSIGANNEAARLNPETGKWEAPETEASKRRVAEIRELTARIDTLRNQAPGLNINYSNNNGSLIDQVNKRIQEQEAWNRKVEEGVKKAEELGKAWNQTFVSLTVQAYSDNPFVKVWADASSALDKLKEDIKGLPKELQEAAIRSQQTFNARQLFGARVDSSLRAFDLREMADRFRNDPTERNRLRQTSLDRYVSDFERRRSNTNVQANEEYIARVRKSIGDDTNLTGQDRLDRQLDLLGGFRTKSVAERSIIDNKILGIAGGLNPADLRGDQRNAIAAAAERQAEREARMQQEAVKAAQSSAESLKNINDYVNTLKGTAEKGGIAAVNKVLVEVKDETAAGVKVLDQPTPSDVSAYYGTFSGGGLTSF